jgi:hypothetical protein
MRGMMQCKMSGAEWNRPLADLLNGASDLTVRARLADMARALRSPMVSRCPR